MKTGRRTRRVIALVAVVALVAASCGTRLDRDDIVRAAGSMGTSNGQAGTDVGALPDATEEGTPGSTDGAQGAGPGSTRGAGPGKRGDKSASGPGGTSASPSGQPIVLGSAGTSSGLGSAGADQRGKALRAWAAATNAKGGIDGRPVKVIVMDDGGDAAKARSQVQELVEKHKVVALVSNDGWTASVNAWKDYVEQKKVPAVGGNCLAKVWETSPIFFSQCPALDDLLYGTVHVAAKNGKGKKFGAIFCTEDASCTNAKDRWFKQGYAKRAGLDPVYHADVSLTQPDFTSECIQARNAGVEVFAPIVDPAAVKRVAASCRRQNFKPTYVMPDSVAAADTPKYLDGVVSAQPVFPFAGASGSSYQEFMAAWSKYNQEPPGPFAAHAWAGAKVFEKAARSAKQVTRAGLAAALYRFKNEKFGGLTVPLTYGPNGTDNTPCVFAMQGSAGKWNASQGGRPTCW